MAATAQSEPEGVRRRWTLKEIVQGKPIGHPSHAMLVHFPVGFAVAAVGFDVASRVAGFPEGPVAATWLIVAALVVTAPAAATGLVDWWGMVPGSTKRRVATRHMLLQLTASAVFAADLAMRWTGRRADRASTWWIATGAFGLAVLFAGQWLGGKLVYEMGMRVSTARPVGKPR